MDYFLYSQLSTHTVAQSFQLPASPNPGVLKSEFPDCASEKSISDSKDTESRILILQGCYRQLEEYRSNVLEPYNKKLLAFIDQLVVIDRQLETAHRANNVDKSKYKKLNLELSALLQSATQENGNLFQPYIEFARRYKSRASVVGEQKKRVERKQLGL